MQNLSDLFSICSGGVRPWKLAETNNFARGAEA